MKIRRNPPLRLRLSTPPGTGRYATQLLEKFALPADAKIRHLSKGQNVRLGLLLALAHRPRLMILDDPALGLDPIIMCKDFLRDVVEHLQGQNITVFFSSHLLYEVEPVADIIGILHAGRIAVESGTEDLRAQVRQITLPIRTWDAVAPRMPGVLDIRRHGDRIALIVADVANARAVLKARPRSSAKPNSISTKSSKPTSPAERRSAMILQLIWKEWREH